MATKPVAPICCNTPKRRYKRPGQPIYANVAPSSGLTNGTASRRFNHHAVCHKDEFTSETEIPTKVSGEFLESPKGRILREVTTCAEVQ